MLDRIKFGEIAEMNPIESENLTEKQRQVSFDSMGHLKYRDGERFTIHSILLNETKWRILPNYVSFEEAIKALKEGKTVHCHPEWSNGKTSHKITPSDAESIALMHLEIKGEGLFTIIFESNWTIEGDSNV